VSTVVKPHTIQWPVSQKTVEDIDFNFDVLFRALGVSSEGVLPVARGGTGLAEYQKGDLLVAESPTSIAGLAAVAAGNVLLSAGIKQRPVYGKVALTTHVSGVLPIANGGTGETTAVEAFDALSPLTTKGDVLAHDGSHNVRVAVGADGYVLTADSSAPEGVVWAQGGGDHALLSEQHTDSDPAEPVRGDIVAATLAGAGAQQFWLAGEPLGELPVSVDGGAGQAYWSAGEPFSELSTGVKWRRLGLGQRSYVLRSNGNEPEWGPVAEAVISSVPRVKAYKSAHQSIATGANGLDPLYGGTRVTFDLEEFDTDAFHDLVTNNSRLTVPADLAGTYVIIAQGSWDTSSSGRKAVWIYRNGSRIAVAEANGDDGGLGLSFTCTTTVFLEEGDYIELFVRQDTGSPLNLLGIDPGLSWLSMFQLVATSVSSSSSHTLLSTTHTDVIENSVLRGDLIVGQGASPAWQRFGIGASGYVLASDGTDLVWSTRCRAAADEEITGAWSFRGNLNVADSGTKFLVTAASGNVTTPGTINATTALYAGNPPSPAGMLHVRVDSSKHLVFESNGRLGINITTPSDSLHVSEGGVLVTRAPGVNTAYQFFEGQGANSNWFIGFSGIYDSSYVDNFIVFNGRVSGTYAATTLTVPSGARAAWIRFDTNNGTFRFAQRSGTGSPTEEMTLDNAGNLWVLNDCSALSFTDRTRGFEGDALSLLKTVRSRDGEIDHATLPTFARREITVTEPGDRVRTVPGRDLGAMVTLLTVAVQQLAARVEALDHGTPNGR